MITLEHLEELKNVNVTKIDINTLVDIREVKVNQKLPQPERVADYIQQIKNPYCYRQGNFIVKICFSNSKVTLANRLKEALSRTAVKINV